MCCDKIDLVSKNINKNKIKSNYIECVYLFTTLLNEYPMIIVYDYFSVVDEFVKKLANKTKKAEKCIKNKIYDLEISNYINNNELHKIVEHILIE